MLKKVVLKFVLLPAVFVIGSCESKPIPEDLFFEEAEGVFQSYSEICEAESDNLWPTPVCGPLLIIDPETNQIIANQPDPEGQLKALDNYWTGEFPKDRTFANTSVDWLGQNWAMVMRTSLNGEKLSHMKLLFHESFHRIQPTIPFFKEINNVAANNAHLNTLEGRLWMRLELRALAKALQATTDEEMKSHLRNALNYRLHRYQIFEKAQTNERLLDLSEGLAEYTGWVYSNVNEHPSYAAQLTLEAENLESLERSFAYHSIPGYGVLLDKVEVDWHGRVGIEVSPADIWVEIFKDEIGQKDEKNLLSSAQSYGYPVVLEEEEKRAIAIEQQREVYVQRFVEGVKLVLPMRNPQFSFDPRSLFNIDPHGEVYGTITIIEAWGKFSTEDGLLVDWNNGLFIADVKSADDGFLQDLQTWTIELKPGWKIVPDEENWKVEEE